MKQSSELFIKEFKQKVVFGNEGNFIIIKSKILKVIMKMSFIRLLLLLIITKKWNDVLKMKN